MKSYQPFYCFARTVGANKRETRAMIDQAMKSRCTTIFAEFLARHLVADNMGNIYSVLSERG
jgi:hypothetical protein